MRETVDESRRADLRRAGHGGRFRRWVLAAAPVAPGVRAGLTADGGPRPLAASDRDNKGERQNHDAERLPREVASQHAPRGLAGPPAPGTPRRHELGPGETKREALIRRYEHCGQTGDPRYGQPGQDSRTRPRAVRPPLAGGSSKCCRPAGWRAHARLAVGVQVAQQGDLGAVVQCLAVDVQHQRGHRVLGEGAFGGAARPGEPGIAEALDAGQPCGVHVIELLECLRCGPGVVERLVVHCWPAEVVGDPGTKHADDEVRKPPRDRGDRCWAGLGIGEVDNEFAAAGRNRRSSVSPWVDVPGIGHRLPEVFGVGQPVVAGPKLLAPVPVQLLCQLVRPVDAHPRSVALGGPARSLCLTLLATSGTSARAADPGDPSAPLTAKAPWPVDSSAALGFCPPLAASDGTLVTERDRKRARCGGFGGLAFWVLRLIFDAPGTVAGFRRWVLATAPGAPGVRAGLTADGGPRALARRWP